MSKNLEPHFLFRSLWTGGPIRNAAALMHSAEAPHRIWRLLYVGLSYWNMFKAYLIFVGSSLYNIIISTVGNPSVFIFEPFDAWLGIFAYSVMIIALGIVSHAFLIMYLLGFGKISDQLTKLFTSDERMFRETDETVKAAKNAMSRVESVKPARNEEHERIILGESLGRARKAFFNVDIAELCLLMSSILYQRNEIKVQEAVREHQRFMTLPLEERVVGALGDKHLSHIKNLLAEATRPIENQARQWGMEFEAIHDLSPYGGAFAGIFTCQDPPFVTVAFKGSSPFTLTDWLIDATIQRIDARSMLWGQVHQGFYTALFPDVTGVTPRSGVDSSYGAILQRVNKIARSFEGEGKVNVWVTGHSLGAALASLFYARLVKCPLDLSRGNVMQCMAFGTPSLGDADFAFGYASSSNFPYSVEDKEILFRITNNRDIVGRVPPALAEVPHARQFLNKASVLNYSHIGTGVLIFPDGRKPYVQTSRGGKGSMTVFVTDSAGEGPEGQTMSAVFPARGHQMSERFWHKLVYFSPNKMSEKAEKAINKVERGLGIAKKSLNAGVKAAATIMQGRVPGGDLARDRVGSTLVNLLPGFVGDHAPARYYDSLEASRHQFGVEQGGIRY